MIVEDHLIVAMHLQQVAEDLGHHVVSVVPNGEVALAESAKHEPELVLMDINLGSGIDGITAAMQIAAAHNSDIVFVSAYADELTRKRVKEVLPGSRILSKPITPIALRNALR